MTRSTFLGCNQKGGPFLFFIIFKKQQIRNDIPGIPYFIKKGQRPTGSISHLVTFCWL